MLRVILACLNDKNSAVIRLLLTLLCLIHVECKLFGRCRILYLLDPRLRVADGFHDGLVNERGWRACCGLLRLGHFWLLLVELFVVEDFENASEEAHFYLIEWHSVHFWLVCEVWDELGLAGRGLPLARLPNLLLEALEGVDKVGVAGKGHIDARLI